MVPVQSVLLCVCLGQTLGKTKSKYESVSIGWDNNNILILKREKTIKMNDTHSLQKVDQP